MFFFYSNLQNVDHKMKFRSKKGQLPFIELNGEEIADSAIIIKELSAKFEKNLDAALTQEQRNIAHATISMIENHLVWILFYWRTKNPDLLLKGYQVNLQHALGCRLPNGILNFFFRFTFGRKVRNCFDFFRFVWIFYDYYCSWLLLFLSFLKDNSYLFCFTACFFLTFIWKERFFCKIYRNE